MAHRILLIEDEVAISDSVRYSLENEGFTVSVAYDGVSGLASARENPADLIILDLMLPKLSGIDVCTALRRESSVPIIMLTAKTNEIDKVVGLELGADDYVTKPFSTRELVARVRAVLRRADGLRDLDASGTIRAGEIVVDTARRRVTVGEKLVHLPLKQFELLKMLITSRGRVVTREALFQTIWNTDTTYDTGTLDVHIRWLREKIEADSSNPKYIRTIRGVGYKFTAEDDVPD
ncbi:MAG: response regulator transcription factor [Armatimonadota bacterium]|nr:response regulator transcription factor [Armatimonadota bacterium]